MKTQCLIILLAACAATGATASGLRGAHHSLARSLKAHDFTSAEASWVKGQTFSSFVHHPKTSLFMATDSKSGELKQVWKPYHAWAKMNKFGKHHAEELNKAIPMAMPDVKPSDWGVHKIVDAATALQNTMKVEAKLLALTKSPPAGMTAKDVKDGYCAAQSAPQNGEFYFKCDLPSKQDDTWAYLTMSARSSAFVDALEHGKQVEEELNSLSGTSGAEFSLPPTCDQYPKKVASQKACMEGCVHTVADGQVIHGNCYPVDNRCGSHSAPQDGSVYWDCPADDTTFAYYDMDWLVGEYAQCDQYPHKPASQKACVQGCSGECVKTVKKDADLKMKACTTLVEPIVEMTTKVAGAVSCAAADALIDSVCAETTIEALEQLGLDPFADAASAVCIAVAEPFSASCDYIVEGIVAATSTVEKETEKLCKSIVG